MTARSLSLELITRCRFVLLKCREFDSSSQLRALFIAEELHAYRDFVLEAGDRESRVSNLLSALIPRQLNDGRSVFQVFLLALRANQPEGDLVVAEIDGLIDRLRHYTDQDGSGEFRLRFANRDYEKSQIRQLLPNSGSVQVTASGGLGKTFLLRELQRLLRDDGWFTIWIDFADATFASSRANEERFLHSFARQLPDWHLDGLSGHSLDGALHQVSRHITKRPALQQVLVILDNADRGDRELLRWLRAEFLPKLNRWGKVRILASGQRMVPEWEGHRDGRPFQKVPLSEFLDEELIGQIVDDVAKRYGALQVKERREHNPGLWAEDLQVLTSDLIDVSLGHPLAIELCLGHAADEGLLNPHVFRQDLETIRLKCLRPIVRERVLLNLHRPAQDAFLALCTFRYVWPTLIRVLIGGEEELWAPFTSSTRGWEYWWMTLQDTFLIEDAHNDRLMHPVTPLVRRIVSMVQATEQPQIYRRRHEVAYREFERLLCQDAPASRRAAWLIEMLFHATQCLFVPATEAKAYFNERLRELLVDAHSREADEYPDLLTRLLDWLRGDAELAAAVDAFMGTDSYAAFVGQVSDALSGWRAGHYG